MRRLIFTILFLASLSAAANSAAEAPPDSALTSAMETEQVAETVTSTTDKVAVKSTTEKESEIPLNLTPPTKAAEEGNPLFKLVLIFSMVGLVGTGAYIYLRKYSKTNFSAGKYNEIKVLTQHYLGPKKSLAIIRVAGESILIGVTDHNITMIKSLALLDDEVPEEVPSSDFADLFNGAPAAKVSMSHRAERSEMSVEEQDEEEFSIRGVKEVVSKKLKGMRSFQ